MENLFKRGTRNLFNFLYGERKKYLENEIF